MFTQRMVFVTDGKDDSVKIPSARQVHENFFCFFLQSTGRQPLSLRTRTFCSESLLQDRGRRRGCLRHCRERNWLTTTASIFLIKERNVPHLQLLRHWAAFVSLVFFHLQQNSVLSSCPSMGLEIQVLHYTEERNWRLRFSALSFQVSIFLVSAVRKQFIVVPVMFSSWCSSFHVTVQNIFWQKKKTGGVLLIQSSWFYAPVLNPWQKFVQPPLLRRISKPQGGFFEMVFFYINKTFSQR